MSIKEKIKNLLHLSEKYTKTDMVYLAKEGTWLTLGQFISSICAFLLSIAFANLLPKETFGTYKYILSVTGILLIITIPGINTAIAQAVSRGYEGTLTEGLKTRIHWGILGGIISLCLSGYYYYNNNATLTISFLIVAFFIPLIDSFNIYGAFLVGKKFFGMSTQYKIITQIISVSALITVLFLTKNLFIILLGYFIPYTILRFIFFKITIRKLEPNKQKDAQTIAYGKHLTLINSISAVSDYIDRILVYHFLGPVELAIYHFAVAPPEQIKAVLKNIEPLALPKLSIKSKEEIKTTIFPKTIKFGFLIAAIAITYIFFAPLLYNIFLPQYTNSIFYSQIFSISLIGMVAAPIHIALQSQMAKKQLYQFNICASIIKIALMFLFLYFYGLLGIIIARIITRFINIGILSYLVKKI